ncbi:unnamed protein product [Cylicocyclus nassatus]|uniref:C-type lectin n=1 Tax=Cylicocyclus nassatus TaxID=53992 RepID=A0AA36GS72_CYLNA|nr:unnamed protein product [Cylicocyclus nassatus]
MEPLTHGITPQKYLCDVRKSSVWVDVMFVVDSSAAMTKAGFAEVIQFIAASMRDLSVGQMPTQTRVGFITYSDEAKLVYDLTYWRSTNDLISKLSLPYSGSSGTNMAAALQMANGVFNSKSHRLNVPKVIVVVAAAFKKNSESPVPAANTFKDFGGILITVEYLQEGGIPVPILTKIASEGYSTGNQHDNLNYDTLATMLGRANCFCPDNYVPYLNSRPEYGCYRAARMPAERSGAERSCGLEHNGKLVKIENYEKAEFLMNMKPALKSEALIGLKRYGHQFQWQDGSKLTPYDFTMWYNNFAPKSGDECVSMFFDNWIGKYFWRSHSCTKGLPYVCEIAPCSSTNYCSEPLMLRLQAHRMYMAPIKQEAEKQP